MSMMKMRLYADERRLLGFQCTKRETGVGSITPTIDLERGIAVRMQENRDGWCEIDPVSMRDCNASYGGGGKLVARDAASVHARLQSFPQRWLRQLAAGGAFSLPEA